LVIAFLFVSLLFSKEDTEEQVRVLRQVITESLGRPDLLAQVPWENLIDNACEIDFVVQGWDRWADQEMIARALARFFERGGKFRLYVCHPDSLEGSYARSLMEGRLGKGPNEVVIEIKDTFKTINGVRDQLPPEKKGPEIEVIQTNNLNWYFGVLFKGREISGDAGARDVMVFSIYSHTPWRPWNMPALVIYPDIHNHMREWFKAELQHLRSGSGPQTQSPSSESAAPGNVGNNDEN
jgi:hypothetical protein